MCFSMWFWHNLYYYPFRTLIFVYSSSAQEILLGALKPFTRYELAVQSNGANVVGPFSGTVEESTLTDRKFSASTWIFQSWFSVCCWWTKKQKTSTKSTVDGSWHIFGSRTHIKYALQVNPPAIRSSFMYVKQRNEKSFLSYCLRSTWVSHLTLTSHEELLWAKIENVLLNAYRCVGSCFLQK